MPSDVGQVADIDSIEVEQDVRIGRCDALVTAFYRCVTRPEPCIRSGMTVPGPDEDIAPAITFQIDFHSFYDEKMTGIGSAVRNVHPKIISNRVRDWFIAPGSNDEEDNRNAKHVRHFF